MKLDAPQNVNYAATVVAINTIIELEGLDNLIGVPVLGHQALTQKGKSNGDLAIAFTAETQLSEDFCHHNSLYRDSYENADPTEKGYLEKNRRIRAIRLRGHTSNALLMPLSSVAYTGINPSELKVGDTFDTLNGHAICQKYVIPVKSTYGPKATKVERAFRRVEDKLFPEHLETDQYWRNKHLLQPGREVVITQKLHGTSWRGGHVPVARQLKWYEKLLKKCGVTIPDYEYDVVFGSRKVIKDPNNPNQNHYYKDDIWTDYGKKVGELIPEGYIVYGELIGWTPDKAPLQKGYTYHLPEGSAELFVYRVSHINAQGILSDLSWDGVKDFCKARGLKWTPELARYTINVDDIDDFLDVALDSRFADEEFSPPWTEEPLPLSDKKTVDEGFCIRQEGLVPVILKAKSPKFLEHETKLLDKGEVDLESAA